MTHVEFIILLIVLLWIVRKLPTPMLVDANLNDLKQQLARIEELQVEEMDLLCAAVDHLEGPDAAAHVLKLRRTMREKANSAREEWRRENPL